MIIDESGPVTAAMWRAAEVMPAGLRAELLALVPAGQNWPADIAHAPSMIQAAVDAAWAKGYRSLTGLRDAARHILSFGSGDADS